ncbi:hypothetical protein PFISCL1PPCAC_1425 [Pristionchus fissidentatus]|uniref:Uncharacterized protein n=1 Tax=Pristionchus fissidentatus TaxID=1538716 RepID=A0AAV5UTX8_9BILA|nr:hypothetical protein PFISCL1PPCAC_1425 [Pristionchus fissidentatus]
MKLFLLLILVSAVYGQTIEEIESMIETGGDNQGIKLLVKILNNYYPDFVADDEMATMENEFLAWYKTGQLDVPEKVAPLFFGNLKKQTESMKITLEPMSQDARNFVSAPLNLMVAFKLAPPHASTVDEFKRSINRVFIPAYASFNRQSESVKTELREGFPVFFRFIDMRQELFDLLKKHEKKFNA